MLTDSDKGQPEAGASDMRRAIEALSEGFALFDAEDQLLLCNARFRESYPGLDGVLNPGLPWSIFMTEASRRNGAQGLDNIDRHLASGIDAPLTLQTPRPGDRWLRLGLYPIEDGGFVLTEADITDARAAEEMSAQADGLLRDILDACASRIVMHRISDGEIIYQTPAWQQLYGKATSTKPLYANTTGYSDLLADVLATGRVDDFDATMVRADGEHFPARISGRLVDLDGDEAIVASSEDMTQIFAQRDEIVRSNRRLLDAIEALDQGFALFDADHCLVMANHKYMDINACIATSLTPGTPNDTIVEAAVANGHEPLAAAWTRRQQSSADSAYEFELQDGRVFSASRRTTSDAGFVIAWRDVTEEKNNEKELTRRREAELQNEKLNALGQLLAGVAHELNNPLSVVVGHAMMLRDEVDDPNILHGVEKISKSAERCAKIVKTFLAMARQKPVRLESVAMNEIIETAVDVASYGVRKSGARISLNLGANLPNVLADEDQIAQVFINLLVNAEHALASLGDRARLSIDTHYDADTQHVVALLIDNGPGVPDAIRARIFEPFFTTKAVGEGTGIGLALSHRIVTSHAGSLTLADNDAQGACFALTLPVAPTASSATLTTDALSSGNGLRVLVVEDETDVGQMIVSMLKSLGAAATLTHSAEQALQVIDSGEQFDVVLCDIHMPGMGGRAMLHEVQSRWPALASCFAFVTGASMSDDADVIRSTHRHRLLEKPVSPNDLKTLLQQLTHVPQD